MQNPNRQNHLQRMELSEESNEINPVREKLCCRAGILYMRICVTELLELRCSGANLYLHFYCMNTSRRVPIQTKSLVRTTVKQSVKLEYHSTEIASPQGQRFGSHRVLLHSQRNCFSNDSECWIGISLYNSTW